MVPRKQRVNGNRVNRAMQITQDFKLISGLNQDYYVGMNTAEKGKFINKIVTANIGKRLSKEQPDHIEREKNDTRKGWREEILTQSDIKRETQTYRVRELKTRREESRISATKLCVT